MQNARSNRAGAGERAELSRPFVDHGLGYVRLCGCCIPDREGRDYQEWLSRRDCVNECVRERTHRANMPLDCGSIHTNGGIALAVLVGIPASLSEDGQNSSYLREHDK